MCVIACMQMTGCILKAVVLRFVCMCLCAAARSRVPESCCAEGDIMLCTGLKNFNGPPLFFDSHLLEYREVNPYLYTTVSTLSI